LNKTSYILRGLSGDLVKFQSYSLGNFGRSNPGLLSLRSAGFLIPRIFRLK